MSACFRCLEPLEAEEVVDLDGVPFCDRCATLETGDPA